MAARGAMGRCRRSAIQRTSMEHGTFNMLPVGTRDDPCTAGLQSKPRCHRFFQLRIHARMCIVAGDLLLAPARPPCMVLLLPPGTAAQAPRHRRAPRLVRLSTAVCGGGVPPAFLRVLPKAAKNHMPAAPVPPTPCRACMLRWLLQAAEVPTLHLPHSVHLRRADWCGITCVRPGAATQKKLEPFVVVPAMHLQPTGVATNRFPIPMHGWRGRRDLARSHGGHASPTWAVQAFSGGVCGWALHADAAVSPRKFSEQGC